MGGCRVRSIPTARSEPVGAAGDWRAGRCLERRLLLLLVLALIGCSEPTAEEYLTRGKNLLEQQDPRAAVIELKNAARLAPQDKSTRVLLAQAYRTLGQYPAALKELTRALELDPDDAAVRRGLVALLVRTGQHQAALDQIEQRTASLDEALQVLKGEALLSLGRRDEAVEVLRGVPPGGDAWTDARLLLARMAWEAGEVERVRELVHELAAESPGRGEVWLLQAELALEGGDAAEAEAQFSRAEDLLPAGDPRPRLGRARTLLARGEAAAAQELLAALAARHSGSAPVHYLHAMALRMGDDLEAAHAALQRAGAADPDYLPAQLLRGEVLYARGSHEQARVALRAYLSQVPGHAGARKLLAATNLRLGAAAAVAELLEPLVPADGKVNDPQLLMLLGAAHLQTGNLDAGSRYLERAAALAPEAAAPKRSLALGHLLAGDRAGAVAELRTAVELDPGQASSRYLLVGALLEAGELSEARRRAARMAEQRPDDPVAHYLLGAVSEAEGQGEAAGRSYRRAAELAPGYAAPRMRLAGLARRAGDAATASRLYQEVLEANPEHGAALTGLALLAEQAGDGDKAMDLMQQARQADPNTLFPRLALARQALVRGDTGAALELAREAEAIDGEDPRVQVLLARTELASGQASAAARRLEGLARQAPEDAALRLLLGQAQAGAGDSAGARESLASAVELEGGDFPAAQRALVALELAGDRPAQALEVARRVQANHPDRALGYVLAGDARQGAGQWDAAAAAYRDALEREAEGAIAARLAGALGRSGDPAGAEAVLQDWLAEHPQDVRVRLALAQLELQRGAHASARDHYQTILQAHPDHAVALNNLAVAQSRLGATGNALESARRAHELAPDSPAVLDTYGWLLVRNDRLEQGLRLLRQAVAGAPQSRDIRYHLAAALAQGGSPREARAELESILAGDATFEERPAAEQLLASLSAGDR